MPDPDLEITGGDGQYVTTQYGIRSLSYTGPKLWNSLSIDVKKINPFSSFRQYIKNSVIDGYNTIIDS